MGSLRSNMGSGGVLSYFEHCITSAPVFALSIVNRVPGRGPLRTYLEGGDIGGNFRAEVDEAERIVMSKVVLAGECSRSSPTRWSPAPRPPPSAPAAAEL